MAAYSFPFDRKRPPEFQSVRLPGHFRRPLHMLDVGSQPTGGHHIPYRFPVMPGHRTGRWKERLVDEDF